MISDETNVTSLDGTNSSFQFDHKIRGSSEATSNPRPKEQYSVFGDASCGEPLFAQHVVIDFTPNDDSDNDFLQEKVCSFWQFINNSPEIQNLKVKPEKNLFTGVSKTDIASESTKSEPEISNIEDDSGERTAIEMLEYAEKKNLIDSTLFQAKSPQSKCSIGSREYKSDEVSTRLKKNVKKKKVCSCTTTVCSKCQQAVRNKREAPVTVSGDQLSPIRELSRKLNEWDAKHPKSMEPPGHIPTRTSVPDINLTYL